MWASEQELRALEIKPHWWNGFPGGACMFCFAPCREEQCLADGCLDLETGCVEGHKETDCPVQGEKRQQMIAKYKLPDYV